MSANVLSISVFGFLLGNADEDLYGRVVQRMTAVAALNITTEDSIEPHLLVDRCSRRRNFSPPSGATYDALV